ncbi:hypothetical protein CHY_2025 [Carboxydothermus hydrogenoformans Z-2901]|uniref:Uncharacterized protein n=1 Tax=Carboxydothermus hydrogenoformans (strain ATCC BAA-161 / DSM 6008 / Z-2901) TaxID=246194 RepID=Q3AAJ0_CARHZ|nr:hypothetical protein CHY_2025 [Carboxydothermus hydrogenoformans Z-2901]
MLKPLIPGLKPGAWPARRTSIQTIFTAPGNFGLKINFFGLYFCCQ